MWRSNLHFKSQNHVFEMHIIALFFPIFCDEKRKEEGDVDMEVEVDEVDENR